MFISPQFTEGQLVDVMRYCGYPTYSFFGWVFESDYGTLVVRLQNMSATEAAVIINNYLVNLPVLETAIISASDNLDTDQAAVWKHNKNEVADRSSLFDKKRRELCAYIGVSPGRGLMQAGSLIRT